MNKLLSLVKVSLKNDQFNTNIPTSEKSKKKNLAIQIFFIIFLLVFVGLPFGGIGYTQGVSLKDLDINIFKILIPSITFTVPLLTLAFVLTNLFLNREDETYLALPLTSKEIFTSRLITSIIQSYMFIFMFFAPVLLGLLIGLNVSFDIYLYYVVYIILCPVIPVSIVAFLFTLLSKFINFKKHKTILNVIMMVFPVIIILGMQYLSNGSTDGNTSEDMLQSILISLNNVGNTLSCIAFVSIPSIISFSSSNFIIRFLSMLLSIVVTIGVTYLFICLSSKMYYPYLLKHEGNKTNNKKVNDKDYKSTSSFKSLMLSDLKEIVRSPVLSMNLIFPLIMMPLIMIISFVFGFNSSSGSFMELIEQFKPYVDFNNPFVITISITVILFFASMSFASITAFSRLGNNSYFVKIIPVKPIKIILSKVAFGFLSTFVLAFALILGATFIGLFDYYNSILLLLVMIPLILSLNLISISLDLWKPYLNWSNENQLMKNSIKSVIYMLACMFGSFIFVGIGALFFYYVPNSGYILMFVFMLLFSIISFIMYKHLCKENIFKNL